MNSWRMAVILFQEHGQERLGGRRLGGFERSQHPCSDTGRMVCKAATR